MKKTILALGVLASVAIITSCKNDNKSDDATTEQPATDAASTTTDEVPEQPVSDTKTYTVTATPDSASLGKNKEAFVKIKDIKVTELSDPDGKPTGMELTYKLELTNKNEIGGSLVGINTSNFRLELDNGQKIAPNSQYVSAQPEETKTSDEDKFEIPGGAKPVGLSLFMDDTRASVKLEMK